MSLNTSLVMDVALEAIILSTTPAQQERRKHFDKAALAELASSIKAHGLVQPLLVRPWTDSHMPGITHELVAGERRYAASKLAGIPTVLATVRELTDGQVEEIQLIENLQREDLHELAEAEGYEALQKRGLTVDDLVVKVGKSKATIYARMKLLALIPEARKAFYGGKIAASVALLLARIPVPELQKKALKEVSAEQDHCDEVDGTDDASREINYKDQMSVRAATAHIHQNYMLRLADAGFKTSDPDLVPSAGACSSCPKRTGNQPELFGDVKGADVCTDPVCFKSKIAAHAERVIADAAATGQKVITGKDAKKVAPYGVDSHSLQGFVRLDKRDYNAKGTYRQTLGKAYVPTLLQDPETGKMIEIAPQADVNKVHAKRDPDESGRENSWKVQQRAAERKHRLQIAYRVALFKAIREASPKRKQLSREELEGVAEQIYDRLDHDSKKRLLTACGHDIKKRKGGYGQETDWPVQFKQMTDDELVQMARDAILAHELQVWQHSGETRPKALEAAAKRVGVNAAKIEREIKEAAAVKVAAKKKAAKKAAAKPARKPRAKK